VDGRPGDAVAKTRYPGFREQRYGFGLVLLDRPAAIGLQVATRPRRRMPWLSRNSRM
jgi:hypothetical protein